MPDKIRPSEVSEVLLQQLKGINTSIQFDEVGAVLQVSDGVARIYGLLHAEANELLEFENGVMGVVMNLEEDNVGAVLLGATDLIKEGMIVKRTGRIASIRVSENMLGRVIDPLGVPLDGRGTVGGELFEMPLERKAPGVIYRQPVSEPLQTGIKAIDAMIPIGRGQRELIIGDRQTGKTAIAIDTIINQQEVAEQMNDLPESLKGKVKCGGSLTALPIIETQAGDVSAYIPTNVISITDGQIFLETDLFNQGFRPAINVGISVSRVGGSAQIKSMKKVAGTLKIDQAQYRELEAFSKFSSDMDSVTVMTIDRGRKNNQLLIQPQYSPMPVGEQVAILYCGTHGLMRDIRIDQVIAFQHEFLESLRASHRQDVLEVLEGGVINEQVTKVIEDVAQSTLLLFKN